MDALRGWPALHSSSSCTRDAVPRSYHAGKVPRRGARSERARVATCTRATPSRHHISPPNLHAFAVCRTGQRDTAFDGECEETVPHNELAAARACSIIDDAHAHSGKPSCPGAERAAQLRGDARNARAPTAIGAQARPTGEARRSQAHLFLSARFQPFGITIRLHRPAPSPCCTAVQGNEPLDLVMIRATRGLSSTSTAIGTQARGRQVKRGGQKAHMFLYSARFPPFWITIRLHQPAPPTCCAAEEGNKHGAWFIFS